MPVFTVAGRRLTLDRPAVERSLDGVLPEPIREHYAVVGGRRYPPKQVLSEITGIDRADFTTHQARRILQRLGFVTARRDRRPRLEPVYDGSGLPYGGRQAEALEPYIGKWVALGEPDEVLVAADSFAEVAGWLARHGKTSYGIFRVPRSAAETEILGPLP